MSKYYREEDLQRALIGFIRETGIDEKPYDYAVNVLDTILPIEVSDSADRPFEYFKGYEDGRTSAEVNDDSEPTWEQVKDYCFKRNFAIVGREMPKEYIRESGYTEAAEDAISKHDLWRIIEDNAYWITYNETSREKGMTLTGINQALNECPPVVPKLKEVVYGNEHNCIMTMFGECSYSETGCGDCTVVEKVRDALAKTQMKTQNSNEKPKEGEWIEVVHREPLPFDVGPDYLDETYDEKSHIVEEKHWHCSYCDHDFSILRPAWYNYCPNCGAKMKGESDDSTR